MRRAWVLFGALVAAAALLDLGAFHRLEHGDSLVPVLVSLQRWTPFYWDQERYGMLVPLLALPVRDPLGNLLLQRGLMILAGLATVVLLAHWVNPATGVLLGLLALARALEDWFTSEQDREEVRQRLLVDAGLLAIGLGAGQLSIMLYPLVTGQPLRLAVGFLPAAQWPSAWGAMVARAWVEASGWGWTLLAGAALGAVLLLLPSSRSFRRDALARAVTLLGAATAYAAFVGALTWVAENHHHPRYLAPAAVLVHLAVISLLAEPLARAARAARPAFAAALLALPLAALAVGGAPSLTRVHADLDGVAGRFTEEVLAARCQLIAGDYWSVWPAVWHAALVARERGLRDAAGDGPWRVWGVSHRATPTVMQWKGLAPDTLRICRPHGEMPEREAERWLRAYHAWPARVVERRGTLDVLVLVPPLD